MQRPLEAKSEQSDWHYCQEALREVSRTFSRPIELLPERLCRPVTLAYLLCRIADTVEDHSDLDVERRSGLFSLFLDVLNGAAPASEFSRSYRSLSEKDALDANDELNLALPRVMAEYDSLPPAHIRAVTPWVAEMVRGMEIYSRRQPGPDGIMAVESVSDLERYCYFVAGTVGRMLTELFLAELPELDASRRGRMLDHAEEFGIGLQLTNVLKDITDDQHRRVSYIPRRLADREGVALTELSSPASREQAHRVIEPLFRRAESALLRALEYTLAIPPSASQVRLFCLLPLWMAVRTLKLAEGNDAQLVPGEPVKIPREEVVAIIERCQRIHQDDEELRADFAQLTL